MQTTYKIRVNCPAHHTHNQVYTFTTEGLLHREEKHGRMWLTWLDHGAWQGIQAQAGLCCYAPIIRTA